jgi:spore maturation protein CgeB
MRIVVFGLAVSSSWGNGHATLWRGLIRALARRGHHVTFYERDVPYYAEHRDLRTLPAGELVLYANWNDVRGRAADEVDEADVAFVTSYCPDAALATNLVLGSRAMRVFYDLDTPVTLSRLEQNETVEYIPARGLGEFDLVLSYTGGRALDALCDRLGARRAAALYGSVDPEIHRPAAPLEKYAAHVSYLGTYAADRQDALDSLFLAAARALPQQTFVIGGAMYPADFPWAVNIKYVPHVPPGDHPAFYSSAPITLNVTRGAMAAWGHCPSGRLFEAAACGVPVLSDVWDGLDDFFAFDEQILVARNTDEAIAAYRRSPIELARIGRDARERVFDEHTADRRAVELERLLRSARHASAADSRATSTGAMSAGG